MSVANVSQHLQILRAAHLVEADRDGNKVVYCLRRPGCLRLWLALRERRRTAVAGGPRSQPDSLSPGAEGEPSRASMSPKNWPPTGLCSRRAARQLSSRPATFLARFPCRRRTAVPHRGAAARPPDRRLLPGRLLPLRRRSGRASSGAGVRGLPLRGRLAGVVGVSRNLRLGPPVALRFNLIMLSHSVTSLGQVTCPDGDKEGPVRLHARLHCCMNQAAHW